MRNTTPETGFTLIELMIVVAILGVLAAVAVTAYGSYVRKSYNAEATAMLADMRIKQESFRAVFHRYQDLSADGWQPAGTLGPSAIAWPSSLPPSWRQLGVNPGGRVHFRFIGHAGAPGIGQGDFYKANDLTASDAWFDNDFWYGARALQDLDGNKKCEGFVIVSGQSNMATYTETCP